MAKAPIQAPVAPEQEAPEATTRVGDLTFGEAMTRLEEIVTELEESDGLGLEQALALYEQGTVLAGDCRQRLSAAKLRLVEIAASVPAGDDA